MLVVWEQTNAFLFARVVEMVDAEVSKTSTIGCVGSSPTLGTIRLNRIYW